MGALIIVIGVFVIIFKLCEEHSWNKTYPGTFDWNESYKDNIKVTTGQLSKSEYKRRMKNGYYYH